MPRKLPERMRRPERRGRRFRKRESHPTFSSSVPVGENQEVDVLINDIGSRGDGIARVRGFPIFVPRTRVGERLKVKIIKVGDKFAIAEKLSEREDRDEN